MSKKRDRHLQAGQFGEEKKHEINTIKRVHRNRTVYGEGISWYRRRLGYNDSEGDKQIGCLWFIVKKFIMVPLVLALLVLILDVVGFLINYDEMTKEIIVYDNEVLAEYADEQYDATFSKTNLQGVLIVFTVNEEQNDYRYTVEYKDEVDKAFKWYLRDDIDKDISGCIPRYYEGKLSQGILDIVESIANNPYTSIYDLGATPSKNAKVTNLSSIDVDTAEIDCALSEFNEKTGIAVSILIEDSEEVFDIDTQGDFGKLVFDLISLLVIIFLILFAFVQKDTAKENFSSYVEEDT